MNIHAQNLEESIYKATESFIANKNAQSFQNLNTQENNFKIKISSKEEQLAYVFLICNKAYYLQENNKLQLAISNYETARTLYYTNQLSAISDYDITEYCLKPLGNLYTKTNNYTNAENTIKQYLTLAKKSNNSTHYISGIINLSVLYQTRGMHQSVLDLIKQTTGISNINKKQREKLHSLKVSSSIALDKTTNDNLDNEDDLIKHQLAYELALKKGEHELALKHFNLSSLYKEQDSLTIREIAKIHLEKAQLHFLLINIEKANEELQSALHILIPTLERKVIPDKTSLYAENTFIDIFDLLARLQTNSEKALQYYDLSFYVSNLLTIHLTSQESKIANQAANRKRSENCIELLFKIYQNTDDFVTFTRALQYSETHKVSVLKGVFNKKSLLEQHPNDSLLIEEKELLQQQERLTDVLIKTQLGYQSIQSDSLNKTLLDISVKLKTLQKTIVSKYPQIENQLTLSAIKQQLQKDQANLIVYFYGQRNLYQFIISEKNTEFLKIPLTDHFKTNITNFIHLFDNPSAINNNITAFTQQAFSLYKQLHLDQAAASKNAILIPDGLLNFIPFEALLSEQAETINFSAMPFVVTQQNIIYNSSITFYIEPQELSKNKRLLGVFPVFENTSQSLIFSLDEAESIKKQTKGTLLMHGDATKQNFIAAVPNYNILHLSTHATGGDFTNPASLAFSDQPMLLNELYSLDINPDLVVLSACETGIGKLHQGEGAMSIARGFQYAGAKNVLYSLWQINDASTAQLMALFYESYQKSESAFTANRESKLHYLHNDEISNIKKSPYYWSAFVYYGNVVPPKETSPIVYYALGILALLIIVFLIIRKRKTNERRKNL
ncbi:CHAT domain-containing protein [Bizionia argentinensis JUB59]|uniref:CHAT domain-containing protein n=2 Tax=Bizionia TaxID=283785 RepID=G2ECR9_9FLAO|nr:CHAT domain-containing protein [Bizionia argentinensis JUB59]